MAVVKFEAAFHEFWHWATRAEATDDPAGDLIFDLRRDYLTGNSRNFPRIHNLGELKDYLETQGACHGALAAAPKVWRRFVQHARRKGL
jgi:hypothetical protein